MRVRAPPDDVGPREAGRFYAPVHAGRSACPWTIRRIHFSEAGAVSRPSMLPRFIEFLADTLFKGAITLKDTGNGARRPGDVPEAGRTQTRRALVRVI